MRSRAGPRRQRSLHASARPAGRPSSNDRPPPLSRRSAARHRSIGPPLWCCLRRCDAPPCAETSAGWARRNPTSSPPASPGVSAVRTPPVELLVERQFVPRAVDPGDDRGGVQALESRAVELDRLRVAGQRRAEVGSRRLDRWPRRACSERVRSLERQPCMLSRVAGSRPSSSTVRTFVAEVRTATPRRSTSVDVVPAARVDQPPVGATACGRTSEAPSCTRKSYGTANAA